MGLKSNDLEDLVSCLISIDEFDSKIDNEKSIVVGFKVDDEDPAKDLSRFIEKSHIELLDTEVSPAPGPDGYYVVFVEFSRDRDFPKQLLDLLDILEDLNGIKREDYKFTAYKQKGEHEVNEDNLKRKVRLKPAPKIEDENAIIGENLCQSTNKAFAHYLGDEDLKSVLLKLKVEERHLIATEKMLTFSRGLNKHPKDELKGTIFESPQNAEIIDFNNFRLEKNALEIKKQLIEYNNQLKANFNSFHTGVDERLQDLFEVYNNMFNYLSDAKEQLRILPYSGNDIKILTEFENIIKDNLVFALRTELKEYLNLKITSKFASLLDKLGLYKEVFSTINEFFDHSILDSFFVNEGNIVFQKYNKNISLEVVDFGNTDLLFEKYKLDGLPFTINEQARWYARDIRHFLGEGYAINMIKGYLLLSKANDSRSILLRD